MSGSSGGAQRNAVRPSILLICDTYPPVVGGSEVEAQRISAGLIARGYRMLVLTSGGPPMPPVRNWVDPAGVPVRILTRTSRGWTKNMVFALRVSWTLWSERRNYDAVYFLMQGMHLATGLPVARLLHKPIVMKFGGSGVIPAMRRNRTGRVELNWLRKWAARLLVLNEGMVQEGIDDGFPRKLMTWMPNPVDTAQFRPCDASEIAALRERFSIPREATVAIYVGRLSPEKGLPWTLRGFAKAAANSPNVMLILVGDGESRAELEQLTRTLGLNPTQVRFTGRVNIDEVPLWLRASDLFILTSPSEGFSCALAEAMSAGLPSAVSNIPANTQLIEAGQHGLMFPVGDEGAIGNALRTLFQVSAMRCRMGQAARRRVVENYSSDKVVDRYETLFNEVLGEVVPGAR